MTLEGKSDNIMLVLWDQQGCVEMWQRNGVGDGKRDWEHEAVLLYNNLL